MFIKAYISKDVPIYGIHDSLEKIQLATKLAEHSHFFLQQSGVFLGAIRNETQEDSASSTRNISNDDLEYVEKFALHEHANILDTIKIFDNYQTNIIPILNKEQEFVGTISSEKVMHILSSYPFIYENAAILIIEKKEQNYSMSEVCRILEDNNAKILGSFTSLLEQENIQITLKIKSDNLSSVSETFKRFGYTIVQKHYEDKKDSLIENRFEFLQKYMEL